MRGRSASNSAATIGRGPTSVISPAQHVEQLRQLVEAGLAQEAADAGDARIVPQLEVLLPSRARFGIWRARYSAAPRRIRHHRAELEAVERHAAAPDPLVAEQRRSAIAGDEQGHDQEHRRAEHDQQRRTDHVQHALASFVAWMAKWDFSSGTGERHWICRRIDQFLHDRLQAKPPAESGMAVLAAIFLRNSWLFHRDAPFHKEGYPLVVVRYTDEAIDCRRRQWLRCAPAIIQPHPQDGASGR